jgi:rhodanese-related sulfurtransferase
MLIVRLFYRGSVLKFIIDNWMLIAVALVSGLLLVTPVLQGAMDSGLSSTLVVQMMNKERACLVDVRSLPEYNEEHIQGSEHLDLVELEAKLSQTVKNKQLPLIMVCASGARAQKAVAIAKKLGYAQAHSLSGGLKSWKEAGLPLQKPSFS